MAEDSKPKIVQFGKYKGWEMQQVVNSDPGYVQWALSAFANNAGPNQVEFLDYIKTHCADEMDDKEDPFLRDAWYLDSRAQCLIEQGLEPDLKPSIETDIMSVVHCEVEAISIETYKSLLDQDLLRQYTGDPESDFIVMTATQKYYLKPEIVNAAMALHDKYRRNKQADEPHLIAGTPSKVIAQYWISHRVGSNNSPGKWTLFFNRMKERADGLTDFDVCYRLLRDNSDSIAGLSSFKVSTRRPNSNTSNKVDGVVVAYCGEQEREYVIRQLATLLSLKNGKYYWKYHSQQYAKDGVKASNFSYTLVN